ncbi:MAG: hypothetical protein WBA17_11910, partial [Saprospiraceae bacterium]
MHTRYEIPVPPESSFSLSLICSLFIFASCEKEQLTEADNPQADAAAFTTYQGNGDRNLANSTIDATVEDGMLSFADVDAYFKAQTIVGNSSENEFFAWSAARGYVSLWQDYATVRSRFEENYEQQRDAVFSKEERDRYQVVLDDGAYDLIPFLAGRSMASLVNPSGFVLIGNQLHYFSDKVHILVADRNQETVKQIIADPEREWELEGVAVTLQETAERRVEKADVKFLPCPVASVAHRETRGGERIIVEYNTYAFKTTWNPTNTEYNFSLRGIVLNERKAGAIWKRHWT